MELLERVMHYNFPILSIPSGGFAHLCYDHTNSYYKNSHWCTHIHIRVHAYIPVQKLYWNEL